MPNIADTTPRAVHLAGLTKTYADEAAVDNLSLSIAAGEFLTLLGPSGSGKSTTLGMIAGFIRPTSGSIRVGDSDVSMIPPHRRNIGVVFQDYALFPHMTVFENVAFPLRRRGLRGAALADWVREALRLVHLQAVGDRHPSQLSGGQRQRVAIARSVVFRPSVLLMDEPMGALDRRLREALQLEMKQLHRQLGITFVHVTHDQEEALSMSDRVAVMREGCLEQVGSPQNLYERPASTFVAEFIGDANMLYGRLEIDRRSRAVLCDGLRCPVGPATPAQAGEAVGLLVRPERVRLEPAGSSRALAAGTVREVVFLGALRKIVVDLDTGPAILASQVASSSPTPQIGSRIGVAWEPEDAALLPDSRPGDGARESPGREWTVPPAQTIARDSGSVA